MASSKEYLQFMLEQLKEITDEQRAGSDIAE